MTKDTPLLEVKNLVSTYGEHQARDAKILYDINLHIEEGESVAILGRNGMGKTTLLHSIVGLSQVNSSKLLFRDRGSIKYRSHEIIHLPSYKIARLGIAIVPEGRRVFPHLTVLENLEVAARSPKHSTSRTRWNLKSILATFPNLKRILSIDAELVSGGEQQTLAIARALMSNPDLLLLDEPSMGLGPSIVQQLQDNLATLRKMGITIMISEQNLDFIAPITSRIYILEEGAISHTGSMQAFLGSRTLQERYLGVKHVAKINTLSNRSRL